MTDPTPVPDGGSLSEPDFAFDGLSHAEVFNVLSNERRLLVLEYLERREGDRVRLAELVDYVAARETGVESTSDLDPAARKRVYTSLRQFHLPKLAEAGVVDYDGDNAVALTDEGREVRNYVGLVPKDELQWSGIYLAVGAVCGGLLLLSSLEVSPLASLPPLALAAFTVAIFGVCAVAHARTARTK